MSNQSGSEGPSLKGFESVSHGTELSSYISALESFDRLEQLQELKELGLERTGIHAGARVLDVGCGFGLETLRLARLAAPGGFVAGCDLSSDFLAEARRRASAATVDITFEQARVEALPYPNQSFGIVWSERLLIYVPDVTQAASEMRRVLRAGGHVACIEPDISTSTLNLADRSLVRRVMGNEADTNVAHGWLPGQLGGILKNVGFSDICLATRVVVFSRELAASYFAQCGRSAAANGVISDSELQCWTSEIEMLFSEDRLFATVGYFLFTARA
jgi:2-polyprenyl-3-methyl-5-hydroxy-6-metoxy-1,4-benzoquinol methylase